MRLRRPPARTPSATPATTPARIFYRPSKSRVAPQSTPTPTARCLTPIRRNNFDVLYQKNPRPISALAVSPLAPPPARRSRDALAPQRALPTGRSSSVSSARPPRATASAAAACARPCAAPRKFRAQRASARERELSARNRAAGRV